MKSIKRLLMLVVLLALFGCMTKSADASEVTDFEYQLLENAYVSIDGYVGNDAEVSIPETIDGFPVRIINEIAFCNNTTITKVEIPSNVVSIRNSAFYGCTNLEEVVFPASLTEIDGYAFKGCTGLETITFPESLRYIRYHAFESCTNLKGVKLPASVIHVGKRAFYNCTSMSEITVAENSGSFKSVDGVLYTKDGNEIVKYPSAKTGSSYTIPSTVKTVGEYAFDNVTNLTDVVIEEGVITIKEGAFEKCAQLSNIKIPLSVTAIDESAFYQGNDALHIDGVKGSAAEEFAQNSNMSFTGTENPNTGTDDGDSSGDQSGTTAPGGSTGGTTDPDSGNTGNTDPDDSTGNQGGTTTPGGTGGTTTPDEPFKPTVALNATSAPLQVKKSTTAIKIASKMDGDRVAKWTSSNTKILIVNAKTGKITAKKVGTAYVIVTMKSGATAKCKIKVQKKAVTTTKLTVNKSKVTLVLTGKNKQKTFSIVATKKPITSPQKITYKSSNKKIATVSSKGKITAKKKGTVTITVKSGKKTKRIKVTVKKK